MLEILIVFFPLRLRSKTKFSWNVFILLQSFEINFTVLNLFLKVTTKLRLHILFQIFKSGTLFSEEIFSTMMRDQEKVIILFSLIKNNHFLKELPLF